MMSAIDERANPANLVHGKHITCFEGQDIIYMKFGGEVTVDDALELLRRQVEFAEGRGNMYFLIDASDLNNIAPDGRRAVAETLKDMSLRGMAVVNAPLKAKVVAKLVITAINLFRRDADMNPVAFFDTEEEGLAWIDKRRKTVAA